MNTKIKRINITKFVDYQKELINLWSDSERFDNGLEGTNPQTNGTTTEQSTGPVPATKQVRMICK
jgi:hypothetical protein